ncbi:MAG: lysophospholipid acyltransferase family protein [Granulosicoccus sp.]
MSVHLINSLARILSWLPLNANRAIGGFLGKLAWTSNSSLRTITEINLGICFPDMPVSQRQLLAKNSLIETGKQLTECAWIWHRPTQQTSLKIKETVGLDLLTAAQASNKGVIVVSPHIGNWELCSLPLSATEKFTYFYRSPRTQGMDKLLIKWRAHLGGHPASLDATGIRDALKLLKKGGTLGILPDQEPDLNSGQFAPFFNQSALTMTLLPRLAQRSGAHVLLCIAERLPGAEGWRFHILPANPAISGADLSEATIAMNKDVERCIEICPAQYLWDYKRFSTCEDGSRRNYKRNE